MNLTQQLLKVHFIDISKQVTPQTSFVHYGGLKPYYTCRPNSLKRRVLSLLNYHNEIHTGLSLFLECFNTKTIFVCFNDKPLVKNLLSLTLPGALSSRTTTSHRAIVRHRQKWQDRDRTQGRTDPRTTSGAERRVGRVSGSVVSLDGFYGRLAWRGDEENLWKLTKK